ncbi:MAG TPA: CoA transferase [Beijerinckiaceae bacterium]|nr:CoA transferase [Beijerinckiaceae bacterium]
MPLNLLEGVRILAVEQYGAGPFGTQMLADLGAEVIKIENPADGGDYGRTVGPHFSPDVPKDRASYFFQGLNRNKKSLALDISTPAGRDVFLKLVAVSDAVTGNLRGDVPDKLGIAYAQLKEANPRIVCAHLTGYGRHGERARWPGYDYLMQAEAGYFHLTGDPEGAPSRMGLSLIDLMTGAVTGLALVSAVMKARATGQGQDVDVSLFDLALFNLNYIGHWYLNAGASTTRLPRSAHPSLTPCQTYRTKDGWIYLMCNKEKFWPLLCARIGRPELAADARFATFPDRLRERETITALLDEALSVHTTAEWMAVFAGDIPAAPILDVAQALDNPYVRENGGIDVIPLPGGGRLELLASPVRAEGQSPNSPAPGLGEHTESVLRAAGVDPADLAALRAQGIAR